MEERVYFADVTNKYPDSYIGLKDIKKDDNGRNTGIIVKIGDTFQEVAEVLKPLMTTTALIEGINFLNVHRIGGIIFDDYN